MPRLRVQVGGTIGGVNQWSTTTEYNLSSAVPSLVVLQTIADAVQAQLFNSAAFVGSLCTDTTFVAPKLLFYPDGSPTATLVATGGGAAHAGTKSPQHAPQVCVVASLRTGGAGASRRGRSYWPYRGQEVSTAGVVSSAGQGLVSSGILALRQVIIAAIATQSIAATWVVFSPKLNATTQITAVQVGTRADTIRHRVQGVPETYQTYGVPAVVLSFNEGDVTVEDIFRIAANAEVKPLGDSLGEGFLKTAYDLIPIPTE